MAQSPTVHGHDGHAESAEHHIVPLSTYYMVFAALMVFLILTLVAAMLPQGPWNLPIALVIAVIKAGLVMVFFMHLGYSSSLVRYVAGAAFFWLAILFTLTLGDYFTRHLFITPLR